MAAGTEDNGSSALLPAEPEQKREDEQQKRRKERYALYKHAGVSKAEIRRILSISPHTERVYEQDGYVLAYVEQLRLKEETHILLMRDKLRAASLDILDSQISLYRDPTTPAATKASIGSDLLDREGSLPRRTSVEHQGGGPGLPDEQLERVFDALLARGTLNVRASRQEIEVTGGDSNGE